MAKITLDNTEVRDCDNERLLLAKLLQLQQSGSGSSTSDLIAEIQAGVGGKMTVVAGEFGRPTGAGAYTANDVVGNGAPIVFQNVACEEGGTGYITNVRLVKNSTTTSNATFRLWLYSVSPTPIADHSAFTLLYANKAIRLGYVDLVCSTEGAGSDSASALATNINLKFSCAAFDRNLYGVLEAKMAYTPTAYETFWIELTADCN
jgi:hypothetical protein